MEKHGGGINARRKDKEIYQLKVQVGNVLKVMCQGYRSGIVTEWRRFGRSRAMSLASRTLRAAYLHASLAFRRLLFHPHRHQTSPQTIPFSSTMRATHSQCISLKAPPVRIPHEGPRDAPWEESIPHRHPIAQWHMACTQSAPVHARLQGTAVWRPLSSASPPHTPFLISFANSTSA